MSRDSFTDLLSETILSIDNILNEDTDTDSSRETLPALGEAFSRLPTIRDTLRAIAKSRHVAAGDGPPPDATAALSSCRHKAEELRDIINRTTYSDESSGRMERYWNSIKHFGQGNRVDVLLQAMMDDIRPLAESKNVTIPPQQQPKKSVRWTDIEAEARTKLEEFRGCLDSLENRHASLKLFQWLSCSVRPLALNELRWALALDPSSPVDSIKDVTRTMGFIRDDDALERRVETLAHGLVEIKRHEKKTIAQFIHPSVSDYFKNLGLAQLDAEASSPSMARARAHVRLARECIHCFSVMGSPEDVPEMPLFSYANLCWQIHMKEAEERGLWLVTLADDFKFPSQKTFRILTHRLSRYKDTRLNILHLLMERRLVRTLSFNLPRLVESGVDINVRDELGRTPLALAARSGYDELVSALRLSGADPNICDIYGVSPLGHAAKLDSEPVIANLLDPRPPTYPRQIETGSNPPESEYGEPLADGLAQLAWPSDKILPLDPDYAEGTSRTPLAIAASCGNTNIFRLLLDTGKVDTNARDTHGRTPLFLSSKNGHVGIVHLLLGLKAVDRNPRDVTGRSPLTAAAEFGHASVVTLFTETEGVDLNNKDVEGRTPLWRAIRETWPEAFHLLLQTEEVDVNVVDKKGDTLIGYAAAGNRQMFVRHLLKIGRLDKNKRDNWGQTALHIAAKYGHIATLDHILCYPDVEVDSTDRFGMTALLMASSRGRAKAVKRLLDTEEVDINRKDCKGRTPFTLALKHGHAETARVLFDSGKVDFTVRDHLGSTPLAWAVQCKGVEGMVRDMVNDPACDVNLVDRRGWTPLIHAARARDSSLMTSILIDSGKADLNLADLHERTPLSWAASDGDKETVLSLLTRHEGVMVNRPDFMGRTPLSWAASEGNVDAAFSLMNQEGIDIDAGDIMGRSPLFWAMYRGRFEVAELLLSTRRVDLCPQDRNGLTPFDLIDDPAVRLRMNMVVTNWKNRADGLCFYGQPWIPYPSESGKADEDEGYAETVDAWASMSELNLDGNEGK